MKNYLLTSLSVFSLITLFVSCSKAEIEDLSDNSSDGYISVVYLFSLREANVLDLSAATTYYNDRLNRTSSNNTDGGWYWDDYEPTAEDCVTFIEYTDKEIKSTDYYILAQVFNDEALIKDKKNACLKKYRLEPDDFMPAIISNARKREPSDSIFYNYFLARINNNVNHYGIGPDPKIGAHIDNIELRKDKCISLEIRSNNNIFGRKAGEDLSDKFEMVLGTYYYGNERFDYTKNFPMWGKIFDKEMNELMFPFSHPRTINDYLALQPTIFPFMLFHLKEIPEELPIETDFSFEIGLSNGKILKDTTHIVLK